ncbi:MAG: hypothetical protein HQL70_09200 [Magnetococcales bacterium]|nr:hypothetical protein [Magnetococcales bacterium]
MKAQASKPSKTQKMSPSKSQKSTTPQDSFIKNDEWRKNAKRALDIELFEIHLLDFVSSG